MLVVAAAGEGLHKPEAEFQAEPLVIPGRTTFDSRQNHLWFQAEPPVVLLLGHYDWLHGYLLRL